VNRNISKCHLSGLLYHFFLPNSMIGFTSRYPSSFFFFYIDFSSPISQNNWENEKKISKTKNKRKSKRKTRMQQRHWSFMFIGDSFNGNTNGKSSNLLNWKLSNFGKVVFETVLCHFSKLQNSKNIFRQHFSSRICWHCTSFPTAYCHKYRFPANVELTCC